MQKLLPFVLVLIFFSAGSKKSYSQCNPVINGEDTICAGSSTYLYVNDVYQSYSWSTGSTVSYTYVTGPGTVTLNTVDGSFCNGSASITIRQVQPPSVSFNASAAGYTAILTNTSTNTYSYQWLFGDGTTSSSVSPTHLYNVKGNYTVCLNSAESFCPAASYCRSIAIGTSLGMPTDTVFLKLYNNFQLFNLNSVVQNPVDSGFLIAGQYDNCGECSTPLFIKTNKNGQVQWTRNFDYLYDVSAIEYFDSGYVFLSNYSEFSLTKIDLAGNIEWQKYDGVFGDKMLFTFSNTRMGQVLNRDPLEVVIYDENGNVVTQKSYDLDGWDMHFLSFAKTSDGNMILNGQYGYDFPGGGNEPPYDSYDQVAAKMDVNGNFLWLNGIYQNAQCSQNGQPLQNSAGEYLFPGRFYEPTASQYYYYISRFNSGGTYIDSWSIDSLKGDYSMFLSPANNVVVVSRPQAPVYDSLRIVTMDNSFNILSSKKVTAYNASKSTKTYDGYVATAFTYFDANTFIEYPSLCKTSISGTPGCLDGTIPPITYPAFPYVYVLSLNSTAPVYSASPISAGSFAKYYRDTSICRTCTLSTNIQVTNGDTLLCSGETVTLQAPANMYEYTWSTGAHTRAITVSAGGTYTVTVYDYKGCSASASKHVTSGVTYNIEFAITAANGLCEGSSYSIHAYDSTFQSVYGISWASGESGPFVFPTTSGTFTTTFVDQYGCPTTDSVTVQLQPVPPVPNISGAVSVCTGDSVQLCATFTDNGSGPYTFSWNAGAYTDSCVFVPGGTYNVAITNRFGCDTAGTVSHTVTSQPAPVPNLQPQDSAFICPGGNTVLTAGAGFSSYLWSTNATTSSITVNSPGTYSVTVTNGTGCSGTESVTVYSGINYNPVFALDTTNGFCEGTSFQITVHDSLFRPVNAYSWSTGGTNSAITVSASNTYAVTLTDAYGCSSSESIVIQMHTAAPVINISGSSNVCAGATTSLCASFTGNNSGPYSYNWNNGTFTDSCINAGAGTYTLVLSNTWGCSRTSTAHTVTNHVLPVPDIQPSGTVLVCNGASAQLCANTGFAGYLWSNGGTTNCITVPAGNYNVTVTDGFGCTGQDAVTVTNRAVPVPNIQPAGTIQVCPGNDTTLCANAGFAGYLWSNGATINCITVPAGNYSVTVTDGFGCTGTDAVTISNRPAPVPNIQPSGTVLVCTGDDTTLCASTGFAGYQWSTGASTNCITAPAGNYSLTVTDGSGCTGTDAVTIANHAIPSPNIQPSGNVMVCTGNTAQLCANTGFAGYQWSNGATTNCISAAAGNYNITVTDASGCTGTDTVTVTNLALPVPNIQPSGTILVCDGSDTLLCADAGFASYFWSNGLTTSCITGTSGVYAVIVTDANGCQGSDGVTVLTQPIPDAHIQPARTVLVCTGSDTLVCANAGFSSYLWTGGSTTDCITAGAGFYQITVTDAFGCVGYDSVTIVDYQPPVPFIVPDFAPFDTLFSSAATGNQWYEAGVGIIAGATQNYFVPDHNGLYYVIETDADGCISDPSDTTNFIYALTGQGISAGSIKVFPNPTHDDITVSHTDNIFGDAEVKISLYDVLGQVVFETSTRALPEIRISISALAPAVYLLELTGNNRSFVTRVEKW